MQNSRVRIGLVFLFVCFLLQVGTIKAQSTIESGLLSAVPTNHHEKLLFSQSTMNPAVISPTPDNSLSISGEWFLSYQIGQKSKQDFNYFNLKRGYITFKKTLSRNIIGRITPDIAIDREGDGEGDIELRLKYCYINFLWPSFGIFNSPQLEFGLVHRPWLDFEEHINRYRVQGMMFLERNGIFDSGDYGVTFMTLLGEEISKEYQSKINKSYPGRYGSLAIGLYNGGGYHSIEKNKNKSLEWRATLRPFSEFMPGLQISYLGTYGKGNQVFSPDWKLDAGFLSFESTFLIFTMQYYQGQGNSRGTMLNSQNNALEHEGYSGFSELKYKKWHLVGRYDFYKAFFPTTNMIQKRFISGLAYQLGGGIKILLDYEIIKSQTATKSSDRFLELAMDVRF